MNDNRTFKVEVFVNFTSLTLENGLRMTEQPTDSR